MPRHFSQVDVFTTIPYLGNPIAVVLGADGVSDQQMQRFANWTNLSETAFVLRPRIAEADYRVRIFMPGEELPFAGHPTLGSCHAWLEAGGRPRHDDVIVQECAVGPIEVRRTGAGLAFAAPPLASDQPADEDLAIRVAGQLNIDRAAIVDIERAGPGARQVAVLLESAQAVLAVRPGVVDGDLGIAGPCPPGSAEAFEVRAFFPKDGATVEDPVTGSLNALLAQWLLRSGRARPPYVTRQGTALGRHGRVHISRDQNGAIWVAGGTVTCVTGTVEL